jgi:hypothetical protein
VPLQYVTKEAIHAGNRVQNGGAYATVGFVSNGETDESSSGSEDSSGASRAIMLCDDDGVTTVVGAHDERLYFNHRG